MIFPQKGLLIDVPTTPTTALALGNDPLPFSDPLLFVIPSVPGFPTSPLSLATTYVVLPNENHMQLAEAATLNRKSGGAEGSAVRHSCAPPLPAHNLHQIIHRILMEITNLSFVISGSL